MSLDFSEPLSPHVCEHGNLARSCEVCAEWKPRALEAEAAYRTAIGEIERLDREAHQRYPHALAPCKLCQMLHTITVAHGRPIEAPKQG